MTAASNNPPDFAKWLKEKIKNSGKSAKEIASDAGMKLPQLSRLHNKRTQPRAETIKRLARALNVDPLEALAAAGTSCENEMSMKRQPEKDTRVIKMHALLLCEQVTRSKIFESTVEGLEKIIKNVRKKSALPDEIWSLIIDKALEFWLKEETAKLKNRLNKS